MKHYSVTAAAMLTALACTQGHAQTVDATMPVLADAPKVATTQYWETPTASAVSTDTQYVPNLKIKT